MKFELTIEEKDGFVNCVILDIDCQEHTAINSASFHDTESKRDSLNNLYTNIAQVLHQRQFPNDSLVFEKEGEFAVCKGYPEEFK